MLPLWPEFLLHDQLRVFIHPQQLVLLRVNRGIRPVVTQRKIIPVTTLSHQENWQAHLTALREALSEEIWRGAKAHVVISNHYVRYTVIPWNDELSSHEERQAYLRHCFVMAYGDASRQWALLMSKAGYKQAALSSGINSLLINAILAEFKLAGLPLKSISPHLVKAANQARPYIEQQSCWLLSIESGRICLAMIEQGNWHKVSSAACEGELSVQVAALIQRESVIHGLDTSQWPLLCHWPESNGNTLPLSGRKTYMIDHSNWEQDHNQPIYGLALWAE